MKYGLLCYHPKGNIGDEIQSLAARQFLPRVDVLVDREKMKSFNNPEQVKMILNGWYMCEPRQWPPSASVLPLLASIHVSPEQAVTDAWFQPQNREYLRQHGPVGARDTDTLALLQHHDIPAYYSGCLTLTFRRNEQAARGDYVCAVDLSPEVLAHLRRKTDRPVIPVTHWLPPYLESKDTMVLAEMLLDLYQRAHCVITSRLHSAMPCLALQTPVLLLRETTDNRFSGLYDLLRHCLVGEFLSGAYDFDLDAPGDNRQDYLALRAKLIERCCQFIGPEGTAAYAASAIRIFEGLLTIIPIWEKQKKFEHALRALRTGRPRKFGAYMLSQIRESFAKYELSKRKRQ